MIKIYHYPNFGASCTGFHFRIAPDLEGNARKAIVFELTPIEEFLHSSLTEEEEDLGRDSLEELRRKALDSSVEGKSASERKSLIRLRSQAIKLYIGGCGGSGGGVGVVGGFGGLGGGGLSFMICKSSYPAFTI